MCRHYSNMSSSSKPCLQALRKENKKQRVIPKIHSWQRFKIIPIFVIAKALRHRVINIRIYSTHMLLFSSSLIANDGRTVAPQYRGLSSAFTTIFRQEGFRGLYKGVTPNAWGSGSAWGFYFLLYVIF